MIVVNVNVLAFLLHVFRLMSPILVKLNYLVRQVFLLHTHARTHARAHIWRLTSCCDEGDDAGDQR